MRQQPCRTGRQIALFLYFPLPLVIVGYGTNESEDAKYKGVGCYFFAVGGADKVDLTSIKVEFEEDEYMDPYDEFLREINPASAGNLNCYTYVNRTLVDECYDGENPDALVGWYKWNKEADWEEIIAAADTTLKLAPGEKMIDIHQAFLGQFLGGTSFKFVCSGEVVCDTSDFSTGDAKYYFFHNYTPAQCMLTDIEVTFDEDDEYMDPYDEFVRDINPASAGNLACYTYVNRALVDECYDGENPEALVGWYKWNKEADWEEVIAAGDTTLKLGEGEDDIELPAGRAFLGQFLGGTSFTFNFPNPVKPIK